jgi:hypothetical protein
MPFLGSFLAQWDPEMGPPPMAEPSFGIGTLVWLMVIGLSVQVLLGFWGKSRAEDFDVHPWIGFAAGFCLGFIGVAIVPVFRTHRVVVSTNPRPLPPPRPHVHAPPHAPPPSGPQAYAPPPGPPAAAPPPQALVMDGEGYVNCPWCGSRTRGNRKACMSCGNFLPPVQDA